MQATQLIPGNKVRLKVGRKVALGEGDLAAKVDIPQNAIGQVHGVHDSYRLVVAFSLRVGVTITTKKSTNTVDTEMQVFAYIPEDYLVLHNSQG